MCNDDPDVFPVSGGPRGVVLSLALLCPELGWVEGGNTHVGFSTVGASGMRHGMLWSHAAQRVWERA